MKSWQLQEAKAHFSQVVRHAVAKGPQHITVHGHPMVVVISKESFDKLVKPKPSFVKFIRQSPLVGAKLSLSRSKSKTRDIKL